MKRTLVRKNGLVRVGGHLGIDFLEMLDAVNETYISNYEGTTAWRLNINRIDFLEMLGTNTTFHSVSY